MKESRLVICTFIKKMKIAQTVSKLQKWTDGSTVLASVCETEVIDTRTNYHPLIICATPTNGSHFYFSNFPYFTG